MITEINYKQINTEMKDRLTKILEEIHDKKSSLYGCYVNINYDEIIIENAFNHEREAAYKRLIEILK